MANDAQATMEKRRIDWELIIVTGLIREEHSNRATGSFEIIHEKVSTSKKQMVRKCRRGEKTVPSHSKRMAVKIGIEWC